MWRLRHPRGRAAPAEARGPDGTPDRTGHLDRLLARVTEAGVRTAGLQELFALTGGSHAAAAVCGDGILAVREDIGRHNALDKVLGAMLMEGSLPAAPGVRTPGPEERPWIWVSGRASFEVVQKAWSGGFGALVAVGAVSSLAVEVSRRANMTLVGFSRVSRATVYNVAAAPEGPS
ncbi:MAG: formate dehydrogenase accessory sulfurtransferase FdhD [Microthrixaceae bacterium]